MEGSRLKQTQQPQPVNDERWTTNPGNLDVHFRLGKPRHQARMARLKNYHRTIVRKEVIRRNHWHRRDSSLLSTKFQFNNLYNHRNGVSRISKYNTLPHRQGNSHVTNLNRFYSRSLLWIRFHVQFASLSSSIRIMQVIMFENSKKLHRLLHL